MKRTFFIVVLMLVVSSSVYAGLELTSAKIYKKQGDFAKSMEFYDQAVAKEPDNAEAVYERGELLGMIAMDQAQVGIRKRIAGDVPDPQVALLERMVKDFDAVRGMDEKQTKKYLKKIDQIIDDDWWVFYGKAVQQDSVYRAMESTGNMENVQAVVNTGLAAASTAIMLNPKHWSSRFVYAQMLGLQQKDDAYVKAWQDALVALDNSDLKAKEPDGFKSNRRYGNLQLIQYYYAKDDYTKTLEMADLMLKEEPDLTEAVQYKAFSLATLANDETRTDVVRDSLKRVALDALSHAKESNPNDENILYYIGQFNLQLKDTAAAMKAFDEFLLKAPTDGTVLALQGVIYLEGGPAFNNLDLAIKKLEEAKNAEPENGAFWTNYGIALLRKGKNEDGMKAMEKGKALLGN